MNVANSWLFNPGRPCCEEERCGTLAVTTWRCSTRIVLKDATVTLKQGATVIGTANGGETGVVVFDVPAAGTYTIEVSKDRFVTGSETLELTCDADHEAFIVLEAAEGWTCYCAGTTSSEPCYGSDIELLPTTLYLSDGYGTVTLTNDGTLWQGCTIRTVTGSTFHPITRNCIGAAMVDVPVRFSVSCTILGDFYVEIRFPCCPHDIAFQQHPIAEGDCSTFADIPYVCGAGFVGAPTTCSPLSVTMSGELPPSTGSGPYNATRDIYGGTPTFTLSE